MLARFFRIGKTEVLWALGIVAVVFVVIPGLLLLVVLAINATDEAPSEAAQAALRVPPVPAPDERNGYVDSQGLAAPDGMSAYDAGLKELAAMPRSSAWTRRSIGDRMPSCWREDSACLDLPRTAGAVLRDLLEGERTFLDRYRAMQAKPEFVELPTVVESPDDPIAAYQDFLSGLRLSLVQAGAIFNAGDHAGAIAIVDREQAFYRRAAAGSRSLIMKMIAFAGIARADLFASELARRLPAGDKARWGRLEAAVAPLSTPELDVTGPLRFEHAQGVKWRQTRRFVRFSDATYEMFNSFGTPKTRPWWEPLWPYLYRPHYNANRYAAGAELLLRAAAAPSSDFARTAEALNRQADALMPGEVVRMFVNPIGWDHFYLGSRVGDVDYIGRAHGLVAVRTLVRLQIHLRAQGLRDPDAIRSALAGALGKAFVNPLDGRRALFDAEAGAIGFDIPRRLLPASVARSAGKAHVAQDRLWLAL